MTDLIERLKMPLDLYDFYQRMQENKIIISYQGDVHGDIFSCLLEMVERKLSIIEYNSIVRKRIFKIFVEVLQNIYNYLKDFNSKEEGYYTILILLCKNDTTYTIMTGNHIQTEKVEILQKKIDSINAMNHEELRQEYVSRLNDGQLSSTGGAGLGIIDIVRKSKTKLQYDFKKIDDRFSFFSLNVTVTG